VVIKQMQNITRQITRTAKSCAASICTFCHPVICGLAQTIYFRNDMSTPSTHQQNVSIILQFMDTLPGQGGKIGFMVKEKQKVYGKSLPRAALDEFSLTPQARRIWDNIPSDIQIKIMNNVWCRTCSDTTGIGSVRGKVENSPC